MKGGGGVILGGGIPSYGGVVPSKRRWRGLVIGVLGLVILSLLVPLVFLLGLHNGFQSPATPGYISERQNTPSNVVNALSAYDISDKTKNSQMHGDQSIRVSELMMKLRPIIRKDVLETYSPVTRNETISTDVKHSSQPKGSIVPTKAVVSQLPDAKKSRVNSVIKVHPRKGSSDEIGKSCELTYGSYCLWLEEHKEDMKDNTIKKLKDQLFVARAYYPSIAKLPGQDKLTQLLRQNIQELERILSESTSDADLPSEIEKKLQRMEAAVEKAKGFPVDCNNVDKKLRQIFDLTEDEANFHMKQSAFLYKLTVQTMPKSLHCLSLKLTVEYFKSSTDIDAMAENYVDPALQHYVLFSTNILACSVVINSTVMHAKESQNQVFHVLTDGENYFAMKLWFIRHAYKKSKVQVLNIEDLDLKGNDLSSTPDHLFLPEEFRVSLSGVDNHHGNQIRTEYLSIFSHSHYLLPLIFRNLKKVIVLDDDVVVQQDLSALWSLDMEEKVNAAVRFCSIRLGQLTSYLGVNSFNRNSCAWMSGLNVIDLVRWRELDVTRTYFNYIKELSSQKRSVAVESWNASLLTFEDLIHPLDDQWVVSGLGHDYGIDEQSIRKAAVLHYNGNMKPWLELGIPKYKTYWKRFMNREDQFLSDCNVNS